MLGFDKICFNFMNACSPDFDQMNFSMLNQSKASWFLQNLEQIGDKPNICITSVTFFGVGNS